MGEWQKYFPNCDIGEIPFLPWQDVLGLLKSKNPFLKCGSKAGSTIGESHVLCLQPETLNGESLTLMKWKEIFSKGQHQSEHKNGKFYKQDWYAKESFATESLSSHWVLMPKEFVPGSYSKSFDAQESQINKEYPAYEVITASELVGGILQYYLNRGDRLYSEKYQYMTSKYAQTNKWLPWAKTKTKTSDGHCAGIGRFDSGGLRVDNFGYGYDSVGVGAVRRNS